MSGEILVLMNYFSQPPLTLFRWTVFLHLTNKHCTRLTNTKVKNDVFVFEDKRILRQVNFSTQQLNNGGVKRVGE